MNYHLIPAEEQPDLFRQLFALYCQDLQTDDPAIAAYDPAVLADENLYADTDHPYLIYVEDQPAGLVVFMDESAPVGEADCHTYAPCFFA